MKSFTYVITDPVGIHARPAGLLVKKAKETGDVITVSCNGRQAEATRLMALMSLGIRQGMEVTVTVEGDQEEQSTEAMQAFFEENF